VSGRRGGVEAAPDRQTSERDVMATKLRALAGIGALLGVLAGTALVAQTSPTPTPAPAPATPATPAPSAATTPAPAATTPSAPAAARTPGVEVKAEAAPVCTDCHDDQGKSFPANPHAKQWKHGKGLEAAKFAPNIACESCHGNATKHMESGGEDKTDLRVFKDWQSHDFCTTCHKESSSHASFKTGMHANSQAVNCITCHSIHNADAKTAHLNVKPPLDLCQSCHPNQSATMREKPFTHRPVTNVMECTSCHDPHGRPGKESLKLTRAGEPPCLTCHTEKRGPFVFEHPTGLSANAASNCESCHENHGSSNPKQLIRAQVSQLCLECHSTTSPTTLGSQPPSFHNLSLPRYRNCTTCHVAIHGSNLSPQLLK